MEKQIEVVLVEIAKLRVEPGDVIVFHIPDQDRDFYGEEQIMRALKPYVPENTQFIFLYRGTKIQLLSEKDARTLTDEELDSLGEG